MAEQEVETGLIFVEEHVAVDAPAHNPLRERIRERCTKLVALLIIVVALVAFLSLPMYASHKFTTKHCQCAVGEKEPDGNGNFAVLKSTLQTDCNEETTSLCLNFCLSLVLYAPEMYEDRICKTYPDSENFVLKIYYFGCGNDTWKEAHPLWPVCCNGSVPSACNDYI